jgi:GAF domain
MDAAVLDPTDTGLEVIDLLTDPAFARRHLHSRDVALQMEGMRRLALAFVETPDTILQELVHAAVDLCGADSAGISIERDDTADRTDANYYHWVATAGQYSSFHDAMLPRSPSACGVCIERNEPQLFRVNQRFFDIMGIEAPLVTDGILLPWIVDGTRGTIWIMAHARTEAFDKNDLTMMQVLANFAAMGVRQQRQQKTLMEQAKATAAAAMANDLAHAINNPLQSMTNLVYLAANNGNGSDAKTFAQDLSEPVQRLGVLVGKLLAASSNR